MRTASSNYERRVILLSSIKEIYGCSLSRFSRQKRNLSPTLTKSIFKEKEAPHQLRNKDSFKLPKVKTIAYGTESIMFIRQRLWNELSDKIKNETSPHRFKQTITEGLYCSCRLSKASFSFGDDSTDLSFKMLTR